MPPGSGFADGPQDYPQAGPPRIYVARYLPGGSPPYVILPNVQLINDQWRDGVAPHVAHYRFLFDDRLPPDFPRRWHEVFGSQAGIPFYSVKNDDRIVAFQQFDDGSLVVLNDGFAEVPQVDASGENEQVSFSAAGVPTRCYDFPLPGAVTRDGTDPTTAPAATDPDIDRQTERPIHFNPQGRPNMVPADAPLESPISGRKFCTFVDPLIDNRTPDCRAWWTVAEAAIYVMETGNVDINGQPDPYVKLPDFDEVRKLLTDYKPTNPDAPIDPQDESTFTREPILCHDLDVTGDAWLSALEKIIAPYDFGARHVLEWDDADEAPVHRVMLYRRTEPRNTRWFQAPLPGSLMDVSTLDQVAFAIAADSDEIANAFYVHTAPDEWEICAVLGPMFEPHIGDELDPTRARFGAKAGTAPGPEYRLWGAGEAGDEIYDFPSTSMVKFPLDLKAVLIDPNDPDDAPRNYVHVRRPALDRQLVTVGPDGTPAEVTLEISTDYTGVAPALWDYEGVGKNSHWRKVGGGAWRLWEKGFGIEITDDEPWNWSIGKLPAAEGDDNSPFRTGRVDVITCMANPTPENPRFWLRLRARIAADRGIKAYAARRPASPTRFDVVRRDDCRDRFRRTMISPTVPGRSVSSGQSVPGVQVVRDDTTHALDHAKARRRAHEALGMAGQVTIPYLAHAYSLGDQVLGFQGRDLDLNELDGFSQGEKPQYPTIVGIDRHYEENFSTVLLIGDTRGEPAFRPNFSTAATRKEARQASAAASAARASAAAARAAAGSIPMPTAGGTPGFGFFPGATNLPAGWQQQLGRDSAREAMATGEPSDAAATRAQLANQGPAPDARNPARG